MIRGRDVVLDKDGGTVVAIPWIVPKGRHTGRCHIREDKQQNYDAFGLMFHLIKRSPLWFFKSKLSSYRCI